MDKLEISEKSEITQIIKERAKNNKKQDGNRLLIVVGGGGMAGAYSAGVLTGLERLGLAETFDFAVGISAGAINLGFLLAGKVKLLPELYCEDLISCINPFQPWQFYDFVRVEKIIREKLPDNTFYTKTRFCVGVTSTQNGRGEIIDANTYGTAKSIMASATPPLKFKGGVRLGNVTYFDGEIGDPLPIEKLRDKFAPTHILIVLNRMLNKRQPNLPLWQKISFGTFMCLYAPQLWDKYLFWDITYGRSLKFLEDMSKKISIGIISPREGISETCKDREKIQKTLENGFLSAQVIFK